MNLQQVCPHTDNASEEQHSIQEFLKKLEHDYDIEILHAVDAGSRAWGLANKHSDIDVRFIYVYKNRMEKYVNLVPPKDVLNGFSGSYDWLGFDIGKSLKQAHQMNPSIVEWLWSPIVYKTQKSFVQELRQLVVEQARISPLLFHYRSMAMSHMKNPSTVKNYLNCVRPIAMMVWLNEHFNKNGNKDDGKCNEFIFNLPQILRDIKHLLPSECLVDIDKLISIKMSSSKEGEEDYKSPIDKIASIDKWINSEIGKPIVPQINTQPLEMYNKILRRLFLFNEK